MIQRNQFGKQLNIESAKHLFGKLDIGRKGLIKSEKFIEALGEKENDEITEFLNSIHDNEVKSKSEIIIQKLKQIRENPRLEGDGKTLDDLDWYFLLNLKDNFLHFWRRYIRARLRKHYPKEKN